jgi:alpha-tubulin suppressor-like RCC1 family protein
MIKFLTRSVVCRALVVSFTALLVCAVPAQNATAAALSNVVQVSAGYGHTCATTGSRTVYCWGRNDFGQLGDGSQRNSPHPVQVSGITTATKVVAGESVSCAILLDGTVRCWGKSRHVGAGLDANDAPIGPTQALGLSDVVEIGAGKGHVCALTSSKQIYCWGDWVDGQLGRASFFGSVLEPSKPLPIAGSALYARLTVGPNSNCGVTTTNEVMCWGYGVLTSNLALGAWFTPQPISELTSVTQLTFGGAHACAKFPDGSPRCWGSGGDGRLGDGTSTDSNTPVLVSGLVNPAALIAGANHSCGLANNGKNLLLGRRVIGSFRARQFTPPGLGGVSGANHRYFYRDLWGEWPCMRTHNNTNRSVLG